MDEDVQEYMEQACDMFADQQIANLQYFRYVDLPISQIEFGKKETVIDMTKKLLDDCMPDGGYIFDFDGSLENANPENLDAMFETLDVYGKY